MANLECSIGVRYKSRDLLLQALTHKSYLNENRHWKLPHNERLEFLGDALLEAIVSEHLFLKYPDRDEGEMTQIRGAVVCGAAAEKIANALNLNEFILLSRGESKDHKSRGRILANTVEAIIGALYLDQGREAAQRFVEKFFFPLVSNAAAEKNLLDAKSGLQEKVQDKVGFTPHYKTHKESGPDHNKTFVVGVYVSGHLIAEGEGPSKVKAELDAAKNALRKI